MEKFQNPTCGPSRSGVYKPIAGSLFYRKLIAAARKGLEAETAMKHAGYALEGGYFIPANRVSPPPEAAPMGEKETSLAMATPSWERTARKDKLPGGSAEPSCTPPPSPQGIEVGEMIARLRGPAARAAQRLVDNEFADMLCEVASLIERQAAELRDATKTLHTWHGKALKAQAEIERRKAERDAAVSDNRRQSKEIERMRAALDSFTNSR